MVVELEVFDFDMDKATLIGPAPYAAKFAADMRTTNNNFGLLVDLSHIPTTYESPKFVIQTLRPYITHLHFGNAVVKKGCIAYEMCIRDRDRPVPKEDEVLIKVMAAGFCGTDIHTYKGEHVTNYPIIPGHEFSGVIAEIGEKVTQFKIGDLVITDPNVFCEKCHYCKQNKQIHCEHIEVIGNTRNGAFAEYVACLLYTSRCV